MTYHELQQYLESRIPQQYAWCLSEERWQHPTPSHYVEFVLSVHWPDIDECELLRTRSVDALRRWFDAEVMPKFAGPSPALVEVTHSPDIAANSMAEGG